jgi:alkylation response protein AidB-like acyl-CoA dehydrogenase
MIPALTTDEEALRLEARRRAERVLAPQAAGWEERAEFPREVFRDLCSLGLGAAVLPKADGGAGLSHVGALAVFEELAYGDMAVTFALQCQNSCTRSLWHHGSDAQRQRWLHRLSAGSAIGSYVITEPEAGSDPASMTSTGRKAPGGWALDGEKWLLTNAPVADVFLVSVNTEPEAGTRGITSFVVARDNAGLDVGAVERTLGARALTVGSIRMRGCVVTADAMMGSAGEGFKIALDAVNFARMMWGGISAGVARAALDRALDHLSKRRQFGQRLADFQAVQFQLADLAVEIDKARLLAYRAAALMDADEPYVDACAMAKLAGGDMAVRVTSEALELLGGRGFLAPNPLERYARQARMAQLADGTRNIQRLVIARGLAKSGRFHPSAIPVRAATRGHKKIG